MELGVGNFYRRMNRRFGELPPIKAGRLVNFFKQALVESAFCRPIYPMNSKCERLGLAPFPLLEVTGTNERSTGGVLARGYRN